MAPPLFDTKAPMPAKPRVKIELMGDELSMHWRTPMLGVSLFLMLWLTLWTGGCVMMLHKLLTDFEWFMLLFSTPFFAAWFVVAGLLTYMLFGRHRLVLTRDSLQCSSWAIVPIKSRIVPLDEVATAHAVEECTHHSNDVPQYAWLVRIGTLGEPVKFAKGIKQPEGEWLAETINICLDQMAPDRAAITTSEAVRERDAPAEQLDDFDPLTNARLDESDGDTDVDDERYESEDDSHRAMTFVPGRERWLQPSDSKWQLVHEGSAVVFTNRGRWSLSAIAGVTFINLFWNGIVGVFIFQLFQEFHWMLALFLIPFELIGLVLVFSWFAALSAPAWGSQYSFRLGLVERRWWGPLMGSSKRLEFERLDRIELSSNGSSDSTSNPVKFSTHGPKSGHYRLRLVETTNTTILEIDSLTKGEALWIADTLTYELPGMFDRDR